MAGFVDSIGSFAASVRKLGAKKSDVESLSDAEKRFIFGKATRKITGLSELSQENRDKIIEFREQGN